MDIRKIKKLIELLEELEDLAMRLVDQLARQLLNRVAVPRAIRSS